MSAAKEDFSSLYQAIEDIEDPTIEVLRYFLEESYEEDKLALTDEFVENNDRPYFTFDDLVESLEMDEEELDQALHDLTGRTEREGYLYTNDHTRRSDYHEPHDAYGHRTDGDIERMFEYKNKIDAESPDELSFRLGDKVNELNTMVEVLRKNPSAGQAYLFIANNEARDSTEHGYPETRGVPLSELNEEFGEDVRDQVSPLNSMTSFDRQSVPVASNRISSKAIYDRVEGEPEKGIIEDTMTKLGLQPEYPEEELEEYEGDAAVLYKTRTRDMKSDNDIIRDRLVEHINHN